MHIPSLASRLDLSATMAPGSRDSSARFGEGKKVFMSPIKRGTFKELDQVQSFQTALAAAVGAQPITSSAVISRDASSAILVPLEDFGTRVDKDPQANALLQHFKIAKDGIETRRRKHAAKREVMILEHQKALAQAERKRALAKSQEARAATGPRQDDAVEGEAGGSASGPRTRAMTKEEEGLSPALDDLDQLELLTHEAKLVEHDADLAAQIEECWKVFDKIMPNGLAPVRSEEELAAEIYNKTLYYIHDVLSVSFERGEWEALVTAAGLRGDELGDKAHVVKSVDTFLTEDVLQAAKSNAGSKGYYAWKCGVPDGDYTAGELVDKLRKIYDAAATHSSSNVRQLATAWSYMQATCLAIPKTGETALLQERWEKKIRAHEEQGPLLTERDVAEAHSQFTELAEKVTRESGHPYRIRVKREQGVLITPADPKDKKPHPARAAHTSGNGAGDSDQPAGQPEGKPAGKPEAKPAGMPEKPKTKKKKHHRRGGGAQGSREEQTDDHPTPVWQSRYSEEDDAPAVARLAMPMPRKTMALAAAGLEGAARAVGGAARAVGILKEPKRAVQPLGGVSGSVAQAQPPAPQALLPAPEHPQELTAPDVTQVEPEPTDEPVQDEVTLEQVTQTALVAACAAQIVACPEVGDSGGEAGPSHLDKTHDSAKSVAFAPTRPGPAMQSSAVDREDEDGWTTVTKNRRRSHNPPSWGVRKSGNAATRGGSLTLPTAPVHARAAAQRKDPGATTGGPSSSSWIPHGHFEHLHALVDSQAGVHMVPNQGDVEDFEAFKEPERVQWADGGIGEAIGSGWIRAKAPTIKPGQWSWVPRIHVWVVPALQKPLLCADAIMKTADITMRDRQGGMRIHMLNGGITYKCGRGNVLVLSRARNSAAPARAATARAKNGPAPRR